MNQSKKKLAVWKFASCDGCQLSILDCEDELLLLTDKIEISYFPEATRTVIDGPYDLSLVEGSITTFEDAYRILEIRKNSKFLVTIGACATSGGIQALRNFVEVNEYINTVYAHHEYIKTLETSTPISDHVKVDFELRGCPINKVQLIEVITSYLTAKKPNIPNHSVCVECKLKGHVCIAVTQRIPCLGPVTHAGCGALCPGYYRGCYGCFGPKESPNTSSLSKYYTFRGTENSEIFFLFRNFNAAAPEFLNESSGYENK